MTDKNLEHYIELLKEKIARLEAKLKEHVCEPCKQLHIGGTGYITGGYIGNGLTQGGTISLPQTSCLHTYPSIWNGVGPAPCSKCGYTPPNQFTITCGSSTQAGANQMSGVNILSTGSTAVKND